jgi:hypothetical protein
MTNNIYGYYILQTKQQMQQAVIIKKQESYNIQTKQLDGTLVYERSSKLSIL